MRKISLFLVLGACSIVANAVGANYSTEATITPQKDKERVRVEVRVAQLIEEGGKQMEKVIARPRVDSAPGVPASLYSGLQPSHPNYQKEENVTVDVSWPATDKTGLAVCSVTIKLGDKVVSKSKLSMRVD